MQLSQEQFNIITEHTLNCHPNEMCGILVNDTFIPITNIHSEPENNFTLNPIELVNYLGKIQAILHSHCRDLKAPEILDLRTPSYNDIINQKKSKLPWLIFSTEGINVTYPLEIPRIKNNQYLERPFIWFISDCYSLVQDYYLFELNIELPDHKAEEDFANIRKLHNLFDDYIKDYGFIELPATIKLEKGDLLLLDNAGHTRNHLGIYEDGYVLHQDMLSIKEKVEHFIGRIHKVLRYDN